MNTKWGQSTVKTVILFILMKIGKWIISYEQLSNTYTIYIHKYIINKTYNRNAIQNYIQYLTILCMFFLPIFQLLSVKKSYNHHVTSKIKLVLIKCKNNLQYLSFMF